MSNTNPYSAPQSPFGDNEVTDTYQPTVLSFSGRIGRLRYLAYSIPWNLLAWLGFIVIGIVSAVVLPLMASGSEVVAGIIGIILSGLILAIAYVPMFALSKRRLNDMNQSGWLSLLLILPFINFIFFWCFYSRRARKGLTITARNPSQILAWLLPVRWCSL